jgi:hypothetical protein
MRRRDRSALETRLVGRIRVLGREIGMPLGRAIEWNRAVHRRARVDERGEVLRICPIDRRGVARWLGGGV